MNGVELIVPVPVSKPTPPTKRNRIITATFRVKRMRPEFAKLLSALGRYYGCTCIGLTSDNDVISGCADDETPSKLKQGGTS